MAYGTIWAYIVCVTEGCFVVYTPESALTLLTLWLLLAAGYIELLLHILAGTDCCTSLL